MKGSAEKFGRAFNFGVYEKYTIFYDALGVTKLIPET